MRRTLGDEAIVWIENHCRIPSGPDKGKPVRLRRSEMHTVRCLYDAPDGPPQDQHVAGELAAFLALYHLCGPLAPDRTPSPAQLDIDPWTVWNAADSPTLRPVLKRECDGVTCPRLSTRFPREAA